MIRSLLLAGAAMVGVAAVAQAQSQPDYDLVIRNGRVLDGAGNPWISADIAVKDGKIAAIGKISAKGKREIDATGDYVSPGWIDMMDQSSEVLLKNGLGESKLRQGLTTLIDGEGGTPVPADKIADYFTRLETQGIALNFGTYYSASQSRVEVMGDKAGQPTPVQIAAMQDKVRTAMKAGTMGVASALIYPPDSFQTTQDLIQVVGASSSCNGIYATHMRDESGKLLDAIREAIEIGEKGHVKVEIFHFKAAYAPEWGKLMPQAVKLIQDARDRGVDVSADMYPYIGAGTGLSITVPNWVYEDGEAKAIERLKDPKIREKLKQEVKAGSEPGWSNLVEASGGWDHIVLASAYNAKWDQYQYKTIRQIADTLHRDPVDVAYDIVVDAMPHRAMSLFMMMDERDVVTAIKQPWVGIGSDSAASVKLGQMEELGLVHPRAYGTFPRIIAEYVKRRPVLTLEDAVRKMTSWPANRLGLTDRGVLRTGLAADITVFNYDRLDDKATWEHPFTPAEGVDYVVVNGKVVLDQGKPTAERPGRVLRGVCALPKAGA
jgi:N-acyl-D-amino-acid deacylase